MADTERILSLMVEVGIAGEKDARALKDLLEETASVAGKDMATSLPAGAEAWSKYKNVLGQTAGESEGMNLHGREMKKVLHEIEGVVPGAGQAIEGLTKVLTGAGGGFAVVQLAIEAAKLYWDLYEQSMAAAAQRQAERFDKMRTVAREAWQEMEDYKNKMAKASKSEDPEAEKLARDQAVQAAQFKGRRDLIKAEQERDEAGAQTPEEKAAVKKRYADKNTELDSQEEAAKSALLRSTVSNLKDEIAKIDAERAKNKNEIDANVLERGKNMQMGIATTGYDQAITELTGKNAELAARAERLRKHMTDYGGQADTQEAVHDVNEFGRLAVKNPTVARAVTEGGLAPGAPGVALTEAQRHANTELSKAFGQHQGGIQTMISIMKHAHDVGSTQQQQIEALTNALATLQARTRANSRQTASLAYHGAT